MIDEPISLETKKLINELKSSPLIGPSIKNASIKDSSSILSTEWEHVMLMLSDDSLAPFDVEEKFKSYKESDHRFADFLVPLREKIKYPIIFWLANNNPKGANYSLQNTPELHHVIQLGNPYSFEDLVICLAKIFEYEGISFKKNDWFSKRIKELYKSKMNPIVTKIFFNK